MRTPVAALLWESWRLTRVEMAFRVALALILGGAPLVGASAVASLGNPADLARLMDAASVGTLFVLMVMAIPFWFSIALLKGGRWIDGGKPGFTFSHCYPRPVSTWLLVGVPLSYFAVANAALYVVPAVILGGLFGYAFPLAPLAAWLVAFSLVQATANWWTRSKTVQFAGSMATACACMWLAFSQVEAIGIRAEVDGDLRPAQWPTLFAFSAGDYGVIGSISLAAVALAIAGVARQRHGEASFPVEHTGNVARFAGSFADAVRFPCPTATPMRAQWWFETTRTGVPLVAVGVGLAVAIPLLLAAFAPWEPAHMVAFPVVVLAPLVVLRMGTDNVFGLHRKPGHTYASPFDTSQAIGTLPLVTLKVIVRTSCLLLAMAALWVSLWWSVPLLQALPSISPSNSAALTGGQRAIAATMDALTGPQRAALALLIVTGVSTMVAHAGSLQVFRLLHPMRVYVGTLALFLYTLMFLLWSSEGSTGLEAAIPMAYPWVIAAAISLSTLRVFRLALVERLLAARHAVAAVLLWAICVVSWLALTQERGLNVSAMPLASLVLTLSSCLLPAMAVGLTPWAYSQIRHR